MFTLLVEDPNTGLRDALELIKKHSVSEESRNGPVLRLPKPIIIEYRDIQNNRCLTVPERDANPFFHHIEALWMLSGSNSLEPLLKYNPRMSEYSDDGTTLRGTAYGHRWRKHFVLDQLRFVIEELKRNPTSRRVVMSMWDASADLANTTSKDLPCNLQVMFSVVNGVLDMTVTNRSNDLIYGCMGSNLYHFSFLHEFVSIASGIRQGSYYQFANNLHVYSDLPLTQKLLHDDCDWSENPEFLLRRDDKRTLSIAEKGMEFADEQRMIIFSPISQEKEYEEEFKDNITRYSREVTLPLIQAYAYFKQASMAAKNYGHLGSESKALRISLLKSAIATCSVIEDQYLSRACSLWLYRRLNKLES